MTPTATFPTPYGVFVPVCDHPTAPGEFIFSADAAAMCAGIHDPKERARFVADCTASKRCDMSRLGEYGGGPVPRVALPRPQSPAYPQIPNSSEFDIPIENWVTAVMDLHRWCDRADKLLEIVEINFADHDESFMPILTLGLQLMLTGTLEHLAEGEIECLEAAAFYALSIHPEWSEPAIDWLRPMAKTWFYDWVTARPIYRRFAALCQADSGLPLWIAGGTVGRNQLSGER